MAKVGHMLGYKGTSKDWMIDVYVKKEDGKYKFMDSDLFVDYHEAVPIRWRDFENEDVDPDQYGYGNVKVHGLNIPLGVGLFNIGLIVGTMQENAAYRVRYIKDRELRNILLVRCRGKDLDLQRPENAKITIGQVHGYEMGKPKKIEMGIWEKRELLDAIFDDVLDESAKVGTVLKDFI